MSTKPLRGFLAQTAFVPSCFAVRAVSQQKKQQKGGETHGIEDNTASSEKHNGLNEQYIQSKLGSSESLFTAKRFKKSKK